MSQTTDNMRVSTSVYSENVIRLLKRQSTWNAIGWKQRPQLCVATKNVRYRKQRHFSWSWHCMTGKRWCLKVYSQIRFHCLPVLLSEIVLTMQIWRRWAKYLISYTNACIKAFGRRFAISTKEAYSYLRKYRGFQEIRIMRNHIFPSSNLHMNYEPCERKTPAPSKETLDIK